MFKFIFQIVFFNTEKKDASMNDEKAEVTIQRQGSFQFTPSSSLENVHVYKGGENPMTIKRVYSNSFLCEYNMGR